MPSPKHSIALISLVALLCFTKSSSAQASYTCKTLPDKVEHCAKQNATTKPFFYTAFEKLMDIVFSNSNDLPFGKSVAFITGVSEYKNISPDLDFVENDIRRMKNFLLNDGGFDEVFIAKNDIVTRDLVEHYMFNVLPRRLSKEDRLLFYYSGHGADRGGNTGYLQFAGAQPNNFAGPQVLSVNTTTEWLTLDIKHILIILDNCSAGLGVAKSSNVEERQLMIETLSRGGSRTVITAGTGDQETYGVDGNSVFTHAFLNALESGKADKGDGFITISEIQASVEKDINFFNMTNPNQMTPSFHLLKREIYPGTFIFINPNASNLDLEIPDTYRDKLGIAKKVELQPVGRIRITSYVDGDLYIEDEYTASVSAGEVYQNDLEPGRYTIEIRNSDQNYPPQVASVRKGLLAYITFEPQSFTIADVPALEENVPDQNNTNVSEPDQNEISRSDNPVTRSNNTSGAESSPTSSPEIVKEETTRAKRKKGFFRGII